MRKIRSNRSSPVVPVAAEGAMTMAQMVEIMRALQANVEASRIEPAKMHEDLVASQARNEELSKVTEELRQALQEQRGRPVAEEVAPSSPPRVFPMPFAQAITDTPIPAYGSTVRSSHVSEDGRMILAPLVNIQKTSRRQNARGYDAPSRMGFLSEAQKMSGSSQVRERPVSHTGNATWIAWARP